VVAFAGSTTSFERLQQRIGVAHGDRRRRAVAVRLYLFDILHLDGYDLTQLPLRERKRVLRAAIRWHDPIRFTTHRNEKGEACFREACRKGWEGLIAKRADSAYVHRRSRDWLKFKCVHEQEFVVGGFTDAAGGRPGIGALLLGVFDGECLVYAGKVGTGWDEATRRALHERLRAKERKTSPFAGRVAAGKGARWTEPRMVVEVGFTEWTDAGRLRHPRFLGVRRDKAARKVVRERPRRSGRQP
jgi:bifunctional non-homologous end joining protein LigD